MQHNHLFEIEGEAEVVCVLLTSLFRCVLCPEKGRWRDLQCLLYDEYAVNAKLFHDEYADNFKLFHDEYVDNFKLFHDEDVDKFKLFHDEFVDNFKLFHDGYVDSFERWSKPQQQQIILEGRR